jgi:hypothetical protein
MASGARNGGHRMSARLDRQSSAAPPKAAAGKQRLSSAAAGGACRRTSSGPLPGGRAASDSGGGWGVRLGRCYRDPGLDLRPLVGFGGDSVTRRSAFRWVSTSLRLPFDLGRFWSGSARWFERATQLLLMRAIWTDAVVWLRDQFRCHLSSDLGFARIQFTNVLAGQSHHFETAVVRFTRRAWLLSCEWWFGGLGNVAWVLLLLRQDRASVLLHRRMASLPPTISIYSSNFTRL